MLTGVTVPGEVATGEVVTVTWTAANQGSIATDVVWNDAVLLSDDPLLDETDVLLVATSAAAHTPLTSGASYTQDAAITIPSLGIGQKYLLVIIDRDAAQAEIREDNNYLARPITISAQPHVTITLSPDSDTGLSNTDRLTRDQTPVFTVMANLAGVLASLQRGWHMDASRTVVLRAPGSSGPACCLTETTRPCRLPRPLARHSRSRTRNCLPWNHSPRCRAPSRPTAV